MKSGSIILPLAVVGGALALHHLQGLSDSASKLTAQIVNVKPGGLSAGSITTAVEIEVMNPGRNDIRIDFVLADIKLGGTVIGKISENSFSTARKTKPDFGVIKAQGRERVSFGVKTSIGPTLFGLLMQLVSSGIPKEVSMQGYLMAEGIRTALDYTKPFSFSK